MLVWGIVKCAGLGSFSETIEMSHVPERIKNADMTARIIYDCAERAFFHQPIIPRHINTKAPVKQRSVYIGIRILFFVLFSTAQLLAVSLKAQYALKDTANTNRYVKKLLHHHDIIDEYKCQWGLRDQGSNLGHPR